jgi:ABC-type Mn2+/Zn2+ transport system permease subunit
MRSATEHPDIEAMHRAVAHSYAVGYVVASLGTLCAFVVVRRWMKPGKAISTAPTSMPQA